MIVDCAVYEDGRRRNGQVELDHAYQACRQSGKFASMNGCTISCTSD